MHELEVSEVGHINHTGLGTSHSSLHSQPTSSYPDPQHIQPCSPQSPTALGHITLRYHSLKSLSYLFHLSINWGCYHLLKSIPLLSCNPYKPIL